MQLTVLTENSAGGKFGAEHGLSYLIEAAGTKLLFDTGYSNLFLRNAELLNINLETEVDTIVLSHGHWDHGDGLQHLEGKTLITHPDSFIKRYRKNDHSNVGLKLSQDQAASKFRLVTTKEPYYITSSMLFLGEIPRKNDFESNLSTFVDQKGKVDVIPDDSGLAVIRDNQLIIVSGCAHSGICNMISHASEITGIRKIKAVVGGFHLKHQSLQLKKTIQFFKEKKVSHIYPSHCTELPALSAFFENFGIRQLKSGMVLHL
ncbi:MAG: MBL fold metallo-hydrolase [Bacteroidota bacterium]